MSPTLEQIVVADGQRLLDYAFLVCRDAQLAQDAVQAVLARVAANEWPPSDNVQAYLRRAISNELVSVHRRNRRWQMLLPRLAAPEAGPSSEDRTAARLSLWTAFDALSARQRTAVVLRYYEGLSDEEIADVLDCAPATVRTMLSRSMKLLKSRLEESR